MHIIGNRGIIGTGDRNVHGKLYIHTLEIAIARCYIQVRLV